jgi:hypothetical protein
VFAPDSEQAELFQHSALPLLRRFEDGDSCVLFAYGITNAGKTHTIQGNSQEPGILPRLVEELFSSSSHSGEIELHLSMMEIYQEQIYDLLSKSKKREKLSIRDGHGKLEVPRLSHHRLHAAADAVQLMNQGSSKRCQSKTVLNAESSRSHAMYSITMNKKHKGKDQISVFHIVDLAGAERVNRTKATGFQMKEANNINMSLMQLWRCLNAMKKKSGSGSESVDIIPFRESKLTHLLMPLLSRASVGGVAMIACVNPQPDDYDETLSVLSNASIASKIKEIASVGRVATNGGGGALSSTLYQSTACSQIKEDKVGIGQKFLRKRKAVDMEPPAGGNGQSLVGRLTSHMGWNKKEKAATVNLTAVLAANKVNRTSTASVASAAAASEKDHNDDQPSRSNRSSSNATNDFSNDDLVDILHQMNELQKENDKLLQAQSSRETEIRHEVAMEMAVSTAALLEQIQDLQEQMYQQQDCAGDMTRSVKKARKKMIQSSKDDTATHTAALEEEMENIRIRYELEIAELKDKLHLYEGMMKEYQQEAKHHASVAEEAVSRSPVRSPLMVLKGDRSSNSNASNKSSPGTTGTFHVHSPACKRTSNIELSMDIQTDNDPLKKKRSPSPVNNENRGPPSIFPTGVQSPKFNSSAFRMLRSQVAGK